MEKRFFIYSHLLILLALAACHSQKSDKKDNAASEKYTFDLQGHRGARGLMPENTIAGFRKALKLGVNTLEMDVVVTKDHQLLVSHEPWFNHLITTLPNGDTIAESDDMQYNIYRMTYDETQQFDCGNKPHPRFPEQEKISATKPLLRDVLETMERESKVQGKTIRYNIEIKSMPQGDNVYHPTPEVFCPLVVNIVQEYVPLDRFNIQSFDFRMLKYLHAHYPDITLSALVESGTVATAIDSLGFVPQLYSPDNHLVNSTLVNEAHAHNMKIILWTINDTTSMKRFLALGVDGIITDYPDRALGLRKD